jgi:formylglycine-generating enzyme
VEAKVTVSSTRVAGLFLLILLASLSAGSIFHAGAGASEDKAKDLYKAGNELFEKGQFREAAQKYEEAIEIVSDFAPLYYNLAETQTELKEYEKAINNYREYLRLRPNDQAAKKARAAVRKLEGELAKTGSPPASQPPQPAAQKDPTPQPFRQPEARQAATPTAEPGQPATAQSESSRVETPTAGQAWRDPAAGIEFVWIPAGCFKMGSPWNEYGRILWESPVHQVCLDGFWMGKYEVTQGQWEKIMGSNPSIHYRKGGNYPADSVSWNDTRDFIKKLEDLGANEKKFRLPTEAEWEYACRAGTTTIYYWGEKEAEACLYENVMDEDGKRFHGEEKSFPCKDNYAEVAPVGQFKPNKFGLHDMLGNVAEWCEDNFNPLAYTGHSEKNPIENHPVPLRVIRGSDWRSEDMYARCAKRGSSEAALKSPTRGFRLVRLP